MEQSPTPTLRMYGGTWSALIPGVVLIVPMAWMSIQERASITGFWVAGFAALVAGLLLARSKSEYAESVVRGLSSRTGAVIISAFIFAGVFGSLLAGGGLVSGLLWFGLETGIQGAAFTVLAFLLACVFAVGTGTSVGTVVALVPVLYPAGVLLGADPMMLAVALLAGGAFGDNLAPISDTTIASAFTQGASMGDVVKSRLPLALAAASVSAVVFAVTGGGGEVADASVVGAETDPLGLLMIIPFAVVIALAVFGRHIIESLMWGSVAAIVVGGLSRQLDMSAVFSIPAERDGSTGLVEEGISGITAAVILVLFILALAQVWSETGLMQRILVQLEAKAAKGVRSAELTIIAVSVLFTIPLGANAPAILLVGPTLAKPLGDHYNLAPARTANLLDCSVCTVFYMLPWHNAVIVWYATLLVAADKYGLEAPSISAAFANPYAWALLVVIVVSALTGWNRSYAGPRPADPVRTAPSADR